MKKSLVFALLPSIAAAFAASTVLAADVRVDFSRATGPVKPVNGVGQPPIIGFPNCTMFRYLSEAGIPFSRLHDVGGMFARSVFVDIPNIFRDFAADETDPANYDFAFTDRLVNALVKAGVAPFFRLGVTIENHAATVRRYRIDPPEDFAKWARICEHVVRHYTEGWADGFRHDIACWEIWNEPENWETVEKNEMWHGTFEEYCRLYEVASKHLKAKFPHLKFGGYASCGLGWVTGSKTPRAKHHFDCFHYFLKFVRERECPIDFFSYHSYSPVRPMMEQARYVRDELDKAGFAGLETCLNEWLPAPSHDKLGTAKQAAEVAATLCGFQNGPVDSAAIYDARCGTGNYSPLFNPFTYKPHKAYYAFMAFNELRKAGTAVASTSGDEDVYVSAAKGAGRAAVMVVNLAAAHKPLSMDFGGRRKVASCRITDAARTYEETPVPEVMPAESFAVIMLDEISR